MATGYEEFTTIRGENRLTSPQLGSFDATAIALFVASQTP
jgi:hypothetical protein